MNLLRLLIFYSAFLIFISEAEAKRRGGKVSNLSSQLGRQQKDKLEIKQKSELE